MLCMFYLVKPLGARQLLSSLGMLAAPGRTFYSAAPPLPLPSYVRVVSVLPTGNTC